MSSRARILASLVLIAAIGVTGCDAGTSSSHVAPLETAGPAVTPVPTPAPAAPSASVIGGLVLLAPEVMAANLTPWPVTAIDAGSAICAIRAEGPPVCWGSGEDSRPPAGAMTAIDSGGGGPCGIRADRSVVCWGYTGTDAPKGEFVAVSVSEEDRCALTPESHAVCWPADPSMYEGDDGKPQATPEPPDGPFLDLEVGGAGPCALTAGGEVVCWGWGEPPRTVATGPFIALGDGCGVLATGEVTCFLDFGDGPPSVLPDGPFVTMSGGPGAGCALRAGGELACWGRQGYDPRTDEEILMRTPPGTYTAVSVSAYAACAVRTDRHAVCWGSDDEAVRPSPSVRLEVPPLTDERAIDVTWRGVPFASPVTSIDVEYALIDQSSGWVVAADRPWTGWLRQTTETSGRLATPGGGKYCFRARAHDEDGVTGSWSYGGCASVPVDDRELDASPDWTPVEGDAYFLGTALRATKEGATFRVTNDGLGSIGIRGTTCAGCGTFVIRSYSLDCDRDEQGQPAAGCPFGDQEVDLRGVRKDSVLVVASDNGEQGFGGPIDIVVTSHGKPVIIDAVILDMEID